MAYINNQLLFLHHHVPPPLFSSTRGGLEPVRDLIVGVRSPVQIWPAWYEVIFDRCLRRVRRRVLIGLLDDSHQTCSGMWANDKTSITSI